MFVDAAIGQMAAELKKQGLLETTLIIVTAKHGQSPIDPNRFQEIGTGIATTPADVLAAPRDERRRDRPRSNLLRTFA